MLPALADALSRYTDTHRDRTGIHRTAIAGLILMRSENKTLPHGVIYRPALCAIVQGAKQLTLGSDVFDYRAGEALIISVELPAFGNVTKASKAEPFLGITLEFDMAIMHEVLAQLDAPAAIDSEPGLGVFVERLADPVVDCLLRLVRMLDTPDAIPILYPAVMRELCFWQLTGTNGAKTRKFILPNGHAQRIAKALYILRDDFRRPVRIDELAEAARMSHSSFHQHFKTLTSMTPLQYQKQLRLLEARRLMTADSGNVANAAYQVGYESPSQFSREYARMFGVPPKRDVAGLKGVKA
jgi:AraC-like DNA-binding protein